MKLFIALALLSFNVFALEWNDLEIGQNYKLKQNFQLDQTERSGSALDFLQGDKLVLRDISPLDMIRVIVYVFEYKKCPGHEMKTEMKIIPVQATSPVVEIGAQMSKCLLSIYIETKDIYTTSLIE